MRIIRAARYRSMPWKNGGGTTTEIAVHPEGASMADFDWRVSMAHVGTDGPFSTFPGIERTLSVLTGAGITLAFGDGERVRLDRDSAPYPFAADRPVDGRLQDGPIDDLNVMTRRGRFAHSVVRLTGQGPHRIAHDGTLLLVAPNGSWRVDGEPLGPGDAAIGTGSCGADCLGATGAAALYVVRLTPTA